MKQSFMVMQSQGSVTATLNLDAKARMEFTTGEKELFGVANFGGTFRIPGVVTIGPNFKIKGRIDGELEIHA